MKNTTLVFKNLFESFCLELNLTSKDAQDMMVKFDKAFGNHNSWDEYMEQLDFYIKYYKETVIPHKIAVFKEGMQMKEAFGLSENETIVLLRNHDLSKFSIHEIAYASVNFKKFKDNSPSILNAFKKAWHHHKSVNPHHPEYWFDVKKDGTTKPLKIPTHYLAEMIADWRGAGITYGNHIEVWLKNNLHTFRFHKQTVLELAIMLAKYCRIGTELADDTGEVLKYA